MSPYFPTQTGRFLQYAIPTILISPLIVYLCRQRKSVDAKNDTNKTQMPRNCRFRLDDKTSATLVLSDGRKLGYAQYGPVNGRTVFALHGIPGSRLEAATWEPICQKHNARMIAVDRPGIGWSSPQPGRTILDHARDVEFLAEHLDLNEYTVMGASGGGVYALACAFSMPKKLKGVSVLCGLGPPDMSKRGMSISNWLGFTYIYRFAPWLVQFHFSRQAIGRLDMNDEDRLQMLLKGFMSDKLHEREREWAQDTENRDDVFQVTLRSCRESFAQGYDGILQDGKLLSLPLGFRLEDIRNDLPVQLWYGKHDTNCPPVHGEETAARIGPSAELHIEDETHLSLIMNHKEEMLTSLLACFDK